MKTKLMLATVVLGVTSYATTIEYTYINKSINVSAHNGADVYVDHQTDNAFQGPNLEYGQTDKTFNAYNALISNLGLDTLDLSVTSNLIYQDDGIHYYGSSSTITLNFKVDEDITFNVTGESQVSHSGKGLFDSWFRFHEVPPVWEPGPDNLPAPPTVYIFNDTPTPDGITNAYQHTGQLLKGVEYQLELGVGADYDHLMTSHMNWQFVGGKDITTKYIQPTGPVSAVPESEHGLLLLGLVGVVWRVFGKHNK